MCKFPPKLAEHRENLFAASWTDEEQGEKLAFYRTDRPWGLLATLLAAVIKP